MNTELGKLYIVKKKTRKITSKGGQSRLSKLLITRGYSLASWGFVFERVGMEP